MVRMSMIIYLIDESGQRVRDLPDPNGGRFDAAGDFDNVPHGANAGLTLWLDIDPYDNTVLGSDRMPSS